MLKKTCAVLMSCLVLGATTVPVWTAEASVSVKTLSRTENKVTVECPQVSGGSRSADDKINRALSSQVASFVSEASTLGGGKVHYDVHRSDEDLVSFTLVMTPNMGVEESVGMTFDRKTGELRPLSYYYTKDQLAGLAQKGLQYLYDVDPAKLQTLPDTYYVDRDGSLIGVYHAGAVLDKSEGEIEINLSAAGMDEEGNVTEAPIDHSSAAPAETENASSQGTAVSGGARPAETAAGTGESTGQGLARIRARLAEQNIYLSMRIELAIRRYWKVASRLMEPEDHIRPGIIALDWAVAQKILPKLSGNGAEYEKWLIQFRDDCAGNRMVQSAALLDQILQWGNRRMKFFQFFH